MTDFCLCSSDGGGRLSHKLEAKIWVTHARKLQNVIKSPKVRCDVGVDSLSWLSEEDYPAALPALLASRTGDGAFLLAGHLRHIAVAPREKQCRPPHVVYSLVGVEKQGRGSLSPTVTVHIPASWSVLEPETMALFSTSQHSYHFQGRLPRYGSSQKFNHPTCPFSNEVSIIVSANVSYIFTIGLNDVPKMHVILARIKWICVVSFRFERYSMYHKHKENWSWS